jgi:hypothetical protein
MTRNITTREFLRTVAIIHFTQMFIMVGFGIVAFYLGGQNGPDEQNATLYKYMLMGLVPAGWAAAYFISKNVLASTGQASGLKEKLAKYQTGMLIRGACLEVPGIVGCIGTFVTGDPFLLIFMAIEVVMLFIFRPTAVALVNEVSFTEKEKMLVEDPEGIVYQHEVQ